MKVKPYRDYKRNSTSNIYTRPNISDLYYRPPDKLIIRKSKSKICGNCTKLEIRDCCPYPDMTVDFGVGKFTGLPEDYMIVLKCKSHKPAVVEYTDGIQPEDYM